MPLSMTFAKPNNIAKYIKETPNDITHETDSVFSMTSHPLVMIKTLGTAKNIDLLFDGILNNDKVIKSIEHTVIIIVLIITTIIPLQYWLHYQ